MASVAKDIARAEDISVVKKVCLLLANVEEGERVGRLHFMWWGLGLVVLLGTACAGLSARLLFLLHHQNAQALHTSPEPLSQVRMFWSCAFGGTLKLWQAFWLLYLPVPTIFYVAFGATFAALKTFVQVQSSYLLQFVAFPLFLSLVYLAFLGVSVIVWRCSENTQHRVWTYGARILVILNIAVPLLKLAILWLQIWPKG
jgi:hypothetical protein